jgi:phytoene dehydrogenase-like protein
VHPLALSSPVLSTFPLHAHGLEWIQPPFALAHPLDDGPAVLVSRSLDETANGLGVDAARYLRFYRPMVRQWRQLVREILGPVVHLPRHPFVLGRFGLLAMGPATTISRALFKTQRARAVFAGMAAHSILPLDMLGSAAFGWVLGASAHAVGWPIPRGGSQAIANALASYFESLGGRIVLNTEVRSLQEFSADATVLCDITPRQFLRIAGDRLPPGFQRRLRRYRYGPGVFKLDWALNGPIPWRDTRCLEAGTVHLGGTLNEIAASERAAWEGRIAERPFVLLVQPSLFDATRAPAGQHTGWAYCHVPNGSTTDMTNRIEAQVERFAPGFRARILARHTMSPADLERHNANLVGGDIGGGAANLWQLIARPTTDLYRTPLRNVFLCSSSTPPGGGVHGMCGYHAACATLGDLSISVFPE